MASRWASTRLAARFRTPDDHREPGCNRFGPTPSRPNAWRARLGRARHAFRLRDSGLGREEDTVAVIGRLDAGVDRVTIKPEEDELRQPRTRIRTAYSGPRGTIPRGFAHRSTSLGDHLDRASSTSGSRSRQARPGPGSSRQGRQRSGPRPARSKSPAENPGPAWPRSGCRQTYHHLGVSYTPPRESIRSGGRSRRRSDPLFEGPELRPADDLLDFFRTTHHADLDTPAPASRRRIIDA